MNKLMLMFLLGSVVVTATAPVTVEAAAATTSTPTTIAEKDTGEADAEYGDDSYDNKKDSLFGNVYEMFRKTTIYQSFYNGQYIDNNELEDRLISIK